MCSPYPEDLCGLVPSEANASFAPAATDRPRRAARHHREQKPPDSCCLTTTVFSMQDQGQQRPQAVVSIVGGCLPHDTSIPPPTLRNRSRAHPSRHNFNRTAMTASSAIPRIQPQLTAGNTNRSPSLRRPSPESPMTSTCLRNGITITCEHRSKTICLGRFATNGLSIPAGKNLPSSPGTPESRRPMPSNNRARGGVSPPLLIPHRQETRWVFDKFAEQYENQQDTSEKRKTPSTQCTSSRSEGSSHLYSHPPFSPRGLPSRFGPFRHYRIEPTNKKNQRRALLQSRAPEMY